MKNRSDAGKSCGPKLFRDGEPSGEWALDELGAYAQFRHRQILEGERQLAVGYWRLGQALVLAKQAFKHGLWSQYVRDLGIDKTRASKATAIFQTFDGADEVARLTVEEAYARRQRRRPVKAGGGPDGATHPKEDVQRLRKAVAAIAKRSGDAVHDAAFVAGKEAVILIPAVRKAIGQLQDLLEHLERQASVAAPAAG